MKKLLLLLSAIIAYPTAALATDLVQPVLVVNCPDGAATNYSGVVQPVTISNICSANNTTVSSMTITSLRIGTSITWPDGTVQVSSPTAGGSAGAGLLVATQTWSGQNLFQTGTQNGATKAVQITASSGGGSGPEYGLYSSLSGNPTTGEGLYGEAINGTNSTQYGGYFSATGRSTGLGANIYGAYGTATSQSATNGAANYFGLRGSATGVTGGGSATNHGVYAEASGGTNNHGLTIGAGDLNLVGTGAGTTNNILVSAGAGNVPVWASTITVSAIGGLSGGSAVTDAPNLGQIGSNVHFSSRTTIFGTTSATPVVITGLTFTITPKSASSRFRLHATGIVSGGALNNRINIAFFKNGSVIDNFFSLTNTIPDYVQSAGVWVDSPATTSSTTYDVRISISAGATVDVGDGNGPYAFELDELYQ